jgi:long-subunit acyl-CoA synthetase (AMP-forming)
VEFSLVIWWQVFAETRKEWTLSTLALCRINAVVITIHANLNTEGIITILNQTEATHLITTEEHLDKMQSLADKIQKMQTIIYMHTEWRKSSSKHSEYFELILFIKPPSARDLPKHAAQSPNPVDVAVIM